MYPILDHPKCARSSSTINRLYHAVPGNNAHGIHCLTTCAPCTYCPRSTREKQFHACVVFCMRAAYVIHRSKLGMVGLFILSLY